MPVSNDIAAFSALAHIAADRYGRLHMVWSSGVAEGRNEEQVETDTIYYTAWENGAWSTPVDILTDATYATADDIAVAADGGVYVVWRNRSSLFLSQAEAGSTGSARNWITQDMNLGSVADSALYIDAQDNFHLIYSAHVPAQGQGALGYLRSSDGGNTWSQPVEFLTFDGSVELLTNVQIIADDMGRLHAVWNRNNADESWMPAGVYYAMSDSSGQTWTTPEEVFTGARVAYPFLSPAAQPGRIYMNWLRGVGYEDSKYLRTSDNDGQLWTSSQLIFRNLQGLNGAMPIVVDSSGAEYWVMSGDTPDGSTQIHYSRQSNDSGWTTPLSISPELRDSEFPEALIVNGNQLHIVWNEFINDDIYHVVCQLDAPEIVPAAMPVASDTADGSGPTTEPPSAVPSATPALNKPAGSIPLAASAPPSSRSTVQVIMFAVIPSLLLVAGVVIWQSSRNRRG